MDIRNPTEAELPDLITQVSKAFLYKEGEGSLEEDFPQLYQASNRSNLWGAYEGKLLVGHAGFYLADLKVEGMPLPVAGIGGVFTDPKMQGQGVGSTLIDRCISEARKKGAALAVLWSDKHEFYEKHGFYLVGRQWTIQLDPQFIPKLRAKAKVKETSLKFCEQAPTADFLSQSFTLNEALPLGVARSREEHSLLIGSGSCRIFAAWAGKQLAAYFLIGKGRDLSNYIHEWSGEDDALHLLAAFCLEKYQQPLQVLSPQFMPDEVNWIYALDEAGVPMRPERMGLVKILDFPRLKKLIQDYIRGFGLDANFLKIENPSKGGYTLQWKEEKPMTFEERDFLLFTFGPELPAHQELKGFLPIRLWYWGMDSV